MEARLTLQELLADAAAALDQAAVLLGAAFFGAVGAFLAGNRLHWRLRARRVFGTVAGVRAAGRLYYAVYRYTSPAGRRFEATADVGSFAHPRLITGRKVRLRAFRKFPDRVAEADTQLVEIVGWSCFALMAAGIGVALASWPVTPVTGLMLCVVAFVILYRLRLSMPSGGERPWTSIMREPPPEGLLDIPIRPIEAILAGPVHAERQRKQRIAGLIVTPILVLIGMGVFALGAHLGRTAFLLQSKGARARGIVMFSELKKTLHGSSYYPVVQFATSSGGTVQFRDAMGDTPPSFADGQAVEVLYFADSPQESATIDRGMLNWLAPGALCLGGTFLTVIAIGSRLGVPRQLPASRKAKKIRPSDLTG